jgi:glycosyltransferase involved in cell wall biosynthesis
MSEIKISVIIPVHNGAPYLKRSLEGLLKSSVRPFEIIVVIDGCTDESRLVAEKFNVQVAAHPGPRRGPATARNTGAEMSQGDVLLFLDADVLVRPDTLGLIGSAFEREPELAALFGSYDDKPAEKNFFSQYKNLFHHYVHQNADEEAFTFWAGCGAIRRDVFSSMKGFDETYNQPSIEDIELGYRMVDKGFKVHLKKTIQVKHLKKWSAVSLLSSDFFRRALPWSYLIIRDRALADDLNLTYSSRISCMLVFCLFATAVLAILYPMLIFIGVAIMLLLLLINMPLYRFFIRKRGMMFTLGVIPWHWLYYTYSGLAFGFAGIHSILRRDFLR